MLDPDYLEQAGDLVASVYVQIEAEMLDYLAGRMIAGDIANQRSMTALNNIVQSDPGALERILASHEGEISAAVRAEVSEALRRSDADDLRRIKQGLGVDLPGVTTRQIAASVAGVEEILARRNLLMPEEARRAFLEQSAWAVAQTSSGSMTTERALHSAVRRLEREGVSVVTYRSARTGLQSVQNKVDVAVRRHIRTQLAQDSMRLTEQRLDEAGVELVEVSSHTGSRPSHQEWEGRVYSRSGDKVIGGVRYRDFRTACRVGDVAHGIGGANCRHSYAAYFPGMRRAFRPNPSHPSGLSNKEAYDLTQRQRALEREIRAAKREARGMELVYGADPSPENLAAVAAAKARLKGRQASMRKLVADNPGMLQRSPRREWAGDMPKDMAQKQIRVAFSTSRATAAPQWSNAAVSGLKTPDEVAQYVAARHGANVSPEFKDLPMDAQRDIVAGIDDAVDQYGEASINTVSTMRSKTKDGSYAPDTGTIRISESASSRYLAGFHEAIHAIDTEKSSKMKAFFTSASSKTYNIYSEKVLEEAKRALGIKSNSKAYKDAVLQLMGMNLDIYTRESGRAYEVIAYALDFEAQGKSNALSEAIRRLF